jgi:hypothetical protein
MILASKRLFNNCSLPKKGGENAQLRNDVSSSERTLDERGSPENCLSCLKYWWTLACIAPSSLVSLVTRIEENIILRWGEIGNHLNHAGESILRL